MNIEERDEFNKIILDNVPASIITIKNDGYIISANKYYQSFARHKDYRNHNIYTSDFFIREKLASEYKKLFKDGTIVKRDNVHEKNSRGEDKYFRLIALPLRDNNGNINAALPIGIDNTDVVIAEKKLRELNNNLEKIVADRTRELNKVNKKLNEVLNIKSDFMADVSHELRNPLAIIQLELELLSKELKEKENINNSLEQIFTEIKRMTSMMSDLSLLANSDSTSFNLQYEEFDINEVILNVIKSNKIQAEKKNISLKYKLSDKIKLLADREMIEKLISNLFRNAIKYNKENGWIKLSIKKTETEIILEVEDSGIGISKKDLPNIFKRFYRANNAKSTGKSGSGLGLAICKLIVEMHAGNISVESITNKGSQFIVKLPLKIKTKH